MDIKFSISRMQRAVGVVISLLVVILSLVLILDMWNKDISSFKKLAIYIAFVLGLLNLIKNLVMVDRITVKDGGLLFDFGFGFRSLVEWAKLTKLKYGVANSKSFFIYYTNKKNLEGRVLIPRLIKDIDYLLYLIVSNIDHENVQVDDTVKRVVELYEEQNRKKG